MVIIVMTKKQLMQALAVIKNDDELQAVYKGKYTSEVKAVVAGVKIIFKDDLPVAIILLNEVEPNDIFAAA